MVGAGVVEGRKTDLSMALEGAGFPQMSTTSNGIEPGVEAAVALLGPAEPSVDAAAALPGVGVAAVAVAEPGGRPVRRLALSPSKAGDFKKCPLLYRFRTIDRLPEPSSREAVRGTLVHAALERMFGRPPEERTALRTTAALRPLWTELSADQPEWASLIPEPDLGAWLDSAEALVRNYFALEDPSRFSPESCELAVEIDIGDSVPLRGFIDRVDVAPAGQIRIVDYKTGRSPSETFEGAALYQLKFYALMIYRMRGVIPSQLKLLYLAETLPMTYTPTEPELLAFERGVVALWSTISRAVQTGQFPARKSTWCGWCQHQSHCPEFGGTPPPYPGPPDVGDDRPIPAADSDVPAREPPGLTGSA